MPMDNLNMSYFSSLKQIKDIQKEKRRECQTTALLVYEVFDLLLYKEKRIFVSPARRAVWDKLMFEKFMASLLRRSPTYKYILVSSYTNPFM